MNTYDFRTLNDKEFEAVAIDLISAENGIRIERFKPGKDRGVDGRWFASLGNENIIQCKHWVGSGYKSLARHLVTSERVKLNNLQCTRYVLATSVPLSRANKAALASIMAPYVLSESDIIGAEDLNDMLARQPDVERRHYKLWLSSSTTLSLLLNNAILGRSRAELEQIRHEARLYVVTADHQRAWQQLWERRIVLLTGEPGIGKTTLARQLVLGYVTEGFELVVLEESVSEAENVFSHDAKQVFYFDDFLGRTFLEAIKAKQDSHILRFMSRVARDPTKRFILTSRTNILNQGAELSDLFLEGAIVKNTYELKIGDLGTLDRGLILYNHIWHSSLGEAYVDELYKEKRYFQVIKHKNYNPRLVAFVVDGDKLAQRAADDYWGYVLDTFNNPRGVWDHFFSGQLSQDDRDLTFIAVLNGGRIREDELRSSFFRLPSQDSANAGLTVHRFEVAVRHASGSVLNRSLAPQSETAVYTLYNPSIADYVQAKLSTSRLWEYYYGCIRALSALSHLEQMKSQDFLGAATYQSILQVLVGVEVARGNRIDAYGIRLTRMLVMENGLQAAASEAIRRWMSSPVAIAQDVEPSDYLAVFLRANGLIETDVLWERASELPDYLEGTVLPLDEPDLIASVLRTLGELGLADAHERVRSQVVAEWREGMPDQVKENNVLGSYDDPEDTGAAQNDLEAFITDQLLEMGVDLAWSEVNELCQLIDIEAIINDNIAVAAREDYESDRWREAGVNEVNDTSALEDLFDRTGRFGLRQS